MSAWFDVDLRLAVLLGVVALISMALTLRNARRHRWLLAPLQLACAALLLATLSLRDAASADALAVITAGADATVIAALDPALPRIALPGTPVQRGIDIAPDLATALRASPDVRHVHVIGDGLAAHDRAAVGARALSFVSPASTDTAIVQLDAVAPLPAGAWWTVQGRVANSAAASVELRDPADRIVATVTPDADGRFAMQALARATGASLHRLRLLDGERELQSLPLPVQTRASAPLRVLVLAASPSAELRALRRWALDAGVELDSRIELAPGLVQRRGAAALDAQTLAALDLLIVDERSWPTLATQQPLLRAAVADGLGLLLRITGPIPERVQRDWSALGIDAALAADTPREQRLADIDGALHAWTLQPHDATRAIVLCAADGTPLATQQLLGRGRIGTWTLTDTHRLVTRGVRERHATLWSDIVSAIARARSPEELQLPEFAVTGQRASICGLRGDAQLMSPSGAVTPLLRDALADDCAAAWPSEEGWHRVVEETGTHANAMTTTPLFHVHDADNVAPLLRQQRHDATTALINAQAPDVTQRTDRNRARALFLLAWLLLAAGLWWLERRSRADESSAIR